MDIFRQIGEWGAVTFPQSTPQSTLLHLQEEIEELKARPDDGEELADCVFLLAQLAAQQGIDLQAEVERKFAINRARRWLPPDENGVVRHVKEGA